MKLMATMLGLLTGAVLSISAGSAVAGEWALSLTANPTPVLAGDTVTFSGRLVNPSTTQGVPNKLVVIRAYGHDATCSGPYDEIGPVLTSNEKGRHGEYSVSSAVPGNAGGLYFVKAFATLDDQVVEGACTEVTVTPADAFAITLSITPASVVSPAPVTFTGTLTNPGPSSVGGQPVVVNAYWTDSTCSGPPAYHFDTTTAADGSYTTGPIGTGAGPGNYYYRATSHGVVSSCEHFTITWSASGTIDSASHTGTTVQLPVAGSYRIDLSGTWDNGPWWLVDPEYVQQMDGGGNVGSTLVWAQSWPGYAQDFGDMMINDSFIDWGAYNDAHAYTHTDSYSGPVNLAVADSYYSDNNGSLNYTITYLGP